MLYKCDWLSRAWCTYWATWFTERVSWQSGLKVRQSLAEVADARAVFSFATDRYGEYVDNQARATDRGVHLLSQPIGQNANCWQPGRDCLLCSSQQSTHLRLNAIAFKWISVERVWLSDLEYYIEPRCPEGMSDVRLVSYQFCYFTMLDLFPSVSLQHRPLNILNTCATAFPRSPPDCIYP